MVKAISRTTARSVLEGYRSLMTRISDSKVTANPEEYSKAVRLHPYFPEMKVFIGDWARKELGEGFTAMEVGAGGGNLTEALVKMPFSNLLISDLDEEQVYIDRLIKEFGDVQKVQFAQRDVREPQPETNLDVIFSCAVDHHIAFEDKDQFLKNVFNMLRPGGYYCSCDVLVTPYDRHDDASRLESVTYFHAVIVDEAIRAGDIGPARISFTAWENELDHSDEYKVSPAEYLRLAENAGFQVNEASMHKIGPHDKEAHGIFVSILKRPV